MTSNYRLSFGNLVATSLGIYFRSLGPFVLLAAVALAPWMLMQFWGVAWLRDQDDDLAVGRRGSVRWFPILHIATMGALIVGTQVLHGIVAYGVGRRMRGEATPAGEIVAAGARSFPRVLAVGIVCAALIAIGAFGMLVGALLVATYLYVATPAAGIERLGPGAAIRRSAHLVRGSRGTIFGALLLAGTLHVGSDVVLGFVATTQRLGFAAWTWLDIAATLLLAPFGAILPAVAYFMLRTGKETIDANRVAAVFD